MCRTAHAVLSTAICGVQMLVRVFMTTILMLENVFRMCLQTLYNFISFMLQLISLVPICCVFLITSRMKCFMCGGGGPCPISRGGACDCLMSLFAIIILFFIFRATGVLDKIFYSIGYAKATTHIVRYSASTGSITECSRNDTDTEYVFYPLDTTAPILRYFYVDEETTTDTTTVPVSTIFGANTETSTEIVTETTTEIVTETTTEIVNETTTKIVTLTTTEIVTETTAAAALRQHAEALKLRAEEYGNDKKVDNSFVYENTDVTSEVPPKMKIRTRKGDNDRETIYDNTGPHLSGSEIFNWTTILYYLA